MILITMRLFDSRLLSSVGEKHNGCSNWCLGSDVISKHVDVGFHHTTEQNHINVYGPMGCMAGCILTKSVKFFNQNIVRVCVPLLKLNLRVTQESIGRPVLRDTDQY